ncbi:hypothetical protein R1flu_008261 [Riccia fluitans]|uniref:Uncharacterized protein n=1 Tax=Riccia fluitans TaxID=41844 RepID=A0ABD1YBI8_9MARC
MYVAVHRGRAEVSKDCLASFLASSIGRPRARPPRIQVRVGEKCSSATGNDQEAFTVAPREEGLTGLSSVRKLLQLRHEKERSRSTTGLPSAAERNAPRPPDGAGRLSGVEREPRQAEAYRCAGLTFSIGIHNGLVNPRSLLVSPLSSRLRPRSFRRGGCTRVEIGGAWTHSLS